jgi:hypothetical protein
MGVDTVATDEVPRGQPRGPIRGALVAGALGAAILVALGLIAICSASGGPPVSAGDDTAELQALLDNIPPGGSLTLERKRYRHRGVIHIRVAGAHIDGDGATFEATDDATSAVEVTADGVSIIDLNLTAPLTGNRWTGVDQHKLVLRSDDVTISDVRITGSAGAGIFVSGANNFLLDHVVVRRTRADGIHMTNGSNNGQVNNPTTEWTGDDGVAVVSYGNEKPCTNITVARPVVTGTTWGRGISVVGGQNILYRDIAVAQSNAAGVYVAAEGAPYFTHSVTNVAVLGGTVTGANTNAENPQGAVVVYSAHANHTVGNVTIADVSVSGTTSTARVNAAVDAEGGTVSNIALTGIALRDTTLPALYTSAGVAGGSFTATGWTRDGRPVNVP